METAKEELQSGNEELTTLNEELQNRNAELNHLANDLSNLLVGVNIPIVILGADHRIRRFTPMAEKLLNLIPTDIGRPISDIKPNIDVPDLEAMIASSVRDVRSLEREVQDHDGRWYSLRMRPYRTSENTIEGVLMALVDIDAVKRSRDQVAAERDFSTTLLDMVGALVVVTDGDRKVLVFNRACQEATGYALEEVRGKRPNDFLVPPEEVHIPDAAHAELLRGAKKVRSETHWARKDGARRLISWTGTIMDSSDHLRRYIISAGIDITEQRAAEGRQRELTVALGESQEEYRALAASLLRVQEEERSRIAGELHDEFNQRLAALAIQISSLERGLPDASQDFLRRELRAAEDGLRSLSNGIHELARQIHPSMVELLGLTPALESLCAGTSRQDGMRVRFSHRSVPRIIPREIALCLYRVAQEALRNAAKHSGAHEAKVWVTGSGQAIGLSISDAGAGFDPAAARRAGGLGLIIMEERVRLSGGKLTVRSRRGEGTEISVKVPLPDQEEG